jgi:glycosyltransferase involved in cell wall biosynthesis
MSRKLVVIVPAFNEAEGVSQTLTDLGELRNGNLPADIQLLIYVIDDGSSDDTYALARESGADRIIRHRTNRGLGAAVRSGMNAARADGADMVVKFDADLQHDPMNIPELIQPVIDDEADLVYGKRFDRIEYRMPFLRRTGNRVFTRLMRFLTGWPVEDSQPGIFCVNRAYLERFYLPGDYNYTQQILLDAYHKGMRFAHVDVTFRKRETGTSFVSLKYPFKVLPQMLFVIVGIRPMKIFAPIGLVFLLAALAVFSIEMVQWITGAAEKPVVHVNAVLGLSLFGLQTLFFGILAQLIVGSRRRD